MHAETQSDQDCVVAAFTMEEIDHRFGDTPGSTDAKRTAKAVLSDRQAAWDKMDKRLGYSRAKKAEEEAFAIRAERLNDLFALRSASVAGAAVKLHVVLAMAEEDGLCDEFPWPHIRAVMADLVSLAGERSGI